MSEKFIFSIQFHNTFTFFIEYKKNLCSSLSQYILYFMVENIKISSIAIKFPKS